MASLVDHALSGLAERVLVDGYNLLVQEYALVFRREVTEVVAQRQHRRHHAPHAHLGLVFGVGAAHAAEVARWSSLAVESHHQHVHVGPLAVAHLFRQWRGDVDDVEDAHAALVHYVFPHVAHVRTRAPQLTAHVLAPLFAVALSPLADAEHYVAARFRQRVGHGLIAQARRGTVLRGVAIVVFQVVDAPRGERARVLLLEAVARRASAAG